MVYIFGLGYHETYVNGKKLSDSVLNPGVTDYSKRVFYCVYPFENEIKKGKNVLGVILGYGWAGSRSLLAQIHITYKDGTEDVFCTANCDEWWVTGAPIVSDSIYDGEIYDGRIAYSLKNWNLPEYNADWSTGWMYSMLIAPPKGKLTIQNIEPIKRIKEYSPISSTKINKNTIVFDLGQIFSGWAKIKIKGENGNKITLRYGEKIKEDKTVDQLNLRTAKARDIYILNGNEIEEYEPRFTYHGFRYVQAEIEGDVKILSLKGIYVRSDVKMISEFNSSDKILNKLHKNVLITEGSNLHSIMTDCPQRDERFGWLNDISSRIYQTICNYNMVSFFNKVTTDITDTQDEYGKIADTAPFYTGFRPADPVVVCYLLLGLKSYRFYGDKEVLQNNYKNYKMWVDFLTKQSNENGAVLYSSFGDWCPPGNYLPDEDPQNSNTPGVFVSSAYYYWHLNCISEIALILGKNKEANKYKKLAEKTKIAFNKKYFDEKKCVYSTGTQSTAAIALNLGLVPKEYSKELAKKLNLDIIKLNYHTTTGNQAYRHMFDALTAYGYENTLHKLLVNPEYPGWGYMIACNATTIWERWENEIQQKMHSFCHPMFASFDAWFFNSIAGINVAKNSVAADRIIIKPVILKDLDYVQASIKFLRGKVCCCWKKTLDKIEYKIIIPPNTFAEIHIKDIITINGKKPEKTENININGGGEFNIISKLDKNTIEDN